MIEDGSAHDDEAPSGRGGRGSGRGGRGSGRDGSESISDGKGSRTDRQDSADENGAEEVSVADLPALVAGAATVSGAGLTLVGGGALASALVLGDTSPVLRFGGLAGVSIGFFLLYWGVSALQTDG